MRCVRCQCGDLPAPGCGSGAPAPSPRSALQPAQGRRDTWPVGEDPSHGACARGSPGQAGSGPPRVATITQAREGRSRNIFQVKTCRGAGLTGRRLGHRGQRRRRCRATPWHRGRKFGATSRPCSARKLKTQMAASRRWGPVGFKLRRAALHVRQRIMRIMLRMQGAKMREPAGEGVRAAPVAGGHRDHGAVLVTW